MERRHLRYFVAVAELHSVRSASEQLHVTQPAISRQIQDLEQAIGATLFERAPRGLMLTAAGEAYLSEAREARVDAVNRLARQIASGLRGQNANVRCARGDLAGPPAARWVILS